MNWHLLSSELSPEALAALKVHIDSKSDKSEDEVATCETSACSNNDNKRWQGASNAEYKEQWYWEERFGDEASFEWLLNFEQVEPYLLQHLKHDDSILVIGSTLYLA